MPEDVSGEAEAGDEIPLLAAVLFDALDDGEDCVELFASVPPLSVDEVDEVGSRSAAVTGWRRVGRWRAVRRRGPVSGWRPWSGCRRTGP